MVRVITLALVLAATPSAAQSRRLEPAEVRCPSVLGVGVETDLVFCDVLIQRCAQTDISRSLGSDIEGVSLHRDWPHPHL